MSEYVPSYEREKLIINIVGLPSSGKSSHCSYLEAQGFELYRPSDAIRQYAAAHNLTLRCRQDYQDCHAAMIAQDREAMIRPVLESMADRICIDGLRSPAAMQRLRQQYPGGAFSIALHCPLETRFAYAESDAARTGHRRHITLEQFRADEAPDYHNDDPYMVSMDDMFATADYTIDASRPFEVVRKGIKRVVSDLLLARSGALLQDR